MKKIITLLIVLFGMLIPLNTFASRFDRFVLVSYPDAETYFNNIRIPVIERVSDKKQTFALKYGISAYAGLDKPVINDNYLKYINITQEKLIEISLIAYFVNFYPYYSDYRYYYAAQYLIYNIINPNIEIKIKDNKYAKEIIEIKDKIKKLIAGPQINTILNLNEPVTLEDENQVLKFFDLEYDINFLDINILDNKIEINPLKKGNTNLTFKLKNSTTDNIIDLYLFDKYSDVFVSNKPYEIKTNLNLVINEIDKIKKDKIQIEEITTYDLPNTYEKIIN